ncbi:MAG TPA: DUF971 domain-containing protein [Candidatus Limnocylindrales bacterium]|nr:DUF971 domain-containing protein [Candidatus Limnocylindrales bacterium]
MTSDRGIPESGGGATATAASVPPPSAAGGSPTLPLKIHAERSARTLAIDWADGHATLYDFTALRWLCPCAYCRGEAGMPGWLDSAPTLTDEQTRMTDIHLVGNYAVSPHWGDGHSTGFYTFSLLRERCPCAECTARRAAAIAAIAATTDQHDQHERDPR